MHQGQILSLGNRAAAECTCGRCDTPERVGDNAYYLATLDLREHLDRAAAEIDPMDDSDGNDVEPEGEEGPQLQHHEPSQFLEGQGSRTAFTSPETQYVISLDSPATPCPHCGSHLDVVPGLVASQMGSSMFYTRCAKEHEFQSYVRIPNLYLYDTNDGIGTPFDTSEWGHPFHW